MEERFSDLLRRAKAGDADARSELLSRCDKQIQGWVRRCQVPALRSLRDTMDFSQSVIVDVLEELPTFEDRGEAAFFAWLQAIVENKVTDAKRKGLRRGEERMPECADPPARGAGPATQVAESDESVFRSERARAVLAALSPIDRRIVELRDFRGLSWQEIADTIGMRKANSVAHRYKRAIESLG